jgi:23S rRNA (adenine2503-C2)-methyltransferase
MRRFMQELPQVNLSLSLHAPNDEVRRKIMPVNIKWGVDELISFAREYSDETGRRFSFEYSLFEGVNDRPEHADELAAILKKHSPKQGFHVNLIPGNNVPELGFRAPAKDIVTNFAERLMAKGIRTTTRRELGTDIKAACGQLRNRA